MNTFVKKIDKYMIEIYLDTRCIHQGLQGVSLDFFFVVATG